MGGLSVKIQVKLFAMLAEQLGETVTVVVPEQPTADQIKAAVGQTAPALRQLIGTSRLAVNQGFVRAQPLPLQTTDEVALIPPVSGG